MILFKVPFLGINTLSPEYKTLFPATDYKSQNNKNKSRGILDKCKNCDYFSYKEGYKPHCHYNKNKKSPVIDDNFKCPKEIKY